ncbi:MAG: hypothetical protein DRN04_19125 [Thermoprotei archaeon]|nr:MAG: hypothetical protein DRN04_19125 [Thermoprotei archaeon]
MFAYGYRGVYFNDISIKDYVKRILLSLRDNKKRVIAKLYEREKILWGPYVYRAPNLILEPIEGYDISDLLYKEVFSEPFEGELKKSGTHNETGIFIAYGCDIKQGLFLKEYINTWDIASTMLISCGIKSLKYLDGKIISEIFKHIPSIKRYTKRDYLSREIVKAKIRRFLRKNN